MATHKGTVLDALMGGDEGRTEFLRATKCLNIDGARSAGMVFQADIDDQHWPDQNACQEENKH